MHINISQQLACERGTLSVRDLAEQIALNPADPTFSENDYVQIILLSNELTFYNEIFSDPKVLYYTFNHFLTTIHSLIDTCCPPITFYILRSTVLLLITDTPHQMTISSKPASLI